MKRSKRSASSVQTMAVISVSVLFVFIALFGLYKCFSQPPAPPNGSPSNTTPGNTPGSTTPDAADKNPAPPSNRKEGFYTILVGGLDDDNGGSDTNLLVALDSVNKAVNVVSLPRDTLLNVDWTVKKLNNAYHHGGFERTMEEVENLLGVPVDHYITVDLQAFVELVDAIDGVDFDIPVDMDYDDPYQDLHIHFPKGPRHLTGEEALKVVRWRQNTDGTGYATADIGRIGTQQAFLAAAAKQALSLSNLDKVPAIAQIIQKWVDTDLELSNIIWLGEQVLSIGSDGITFHTLPGDGAGYYKGVAYYTVDPEAALEMVNTYFNPYRHQLTLDDMDILVP